MTSPILALPDFTREFLLEVDGSIVGIAAVLSQVQDRGEVAIAFISRKLTPMESRYSVREFEALAIVWSIKRLENYLRGHMFTVITDHSSLSWMRAWKDAPLGFNDG